MKYLTEKDSQRRQKFKKLETNQIALRTLLQGQMLGADHRLFLTKELHFKTMKKCSKVKIKNRCILTGRAKSIYRFCKLSRIKFKELASQGYVPGVRKSSW
jgi:small subunit ribosomal protein S14